MKDSIMDRSYCEDILEFLFRFEKEGKKSASRQDLISVSGIAQPELNLILDCLIEKNTIVILNDKEIVLTDAGRLIGEKISRKHEVLECFFYEMLGMPIESASEQACLIEHKASDETIDLLDTYLTRGPGWCRRHRKKNEIDTMICNNIGAFEEGDRVRVNLIKGCGRTRRLMDIGVLPGETVIIKRKLGDNKSLVIEVKGVEICLSPEIASIILGEKVL